jgi:hypothetical protein
MNVKKLKLKNPFDPISGLGLLKMTFCFIRKGHFYKGLSKYSYNKINLMVKTIR